jgi:hypothetical protein
LFIFLSLIFYFLSKPKEYNLPNNILILLLLIEFLPHLTNFNFYIYPRYSEHIFISFLIYFLVFLGINLFEKIDLEKILSISSIFVVIPSLIDLSETNQRSSGTIGQANFFGIFLALTILVLIKNFNEYSKHVSKLLLSIYLLLIILLLIKSASVSSLISLFIGLLFIRQHFLKLKVRFAIPVIILIFTIFLFWGNIFWAKIFDVYNQIYRPEQTIISDSFLIRKILWNQTLNIISNNSDNLFFGFGPNSFEFMFEKNRNYILQGLSEENLLFDKPHNYFLEILFSHGVFYLLIFGFMIFKTFNKNNHNLYLIIPILFFIFFNWLDLTLKIFLYLLIFSYLTNYKVKSNIFFNLSSLILITTIFIFFSKIFYQDTRFYFGDTNYVFSYSKEELIQGNIISPIVLTSSLNFMNNENDKRKILELLIKNFPNNQAVLFQLNILF